jgi:hypothetical protein
MLLGGRNDDKWSVTIDLAQMECASRNFKKAQDAASGN